MNQGKNMMHYQNTVNSLSDGRHWDQHQLSILERCPAYREFSWLKNGAQGPTRSPGVRLTEVSVL